MKLCVGLITYCPPGSKERFEILKKSVDSIALLKEQSSSIRIHVWDNNSSEEVREYLSSKDFFYELCFSNEKMFDVVAMNFLCERAKSVNAEYSMYLEDDLLFFDSNFLQDSLDFMDENMDCAALRILRYEYDRKEIYDKFSSSNQKDVNNFQRHYNNISKEKLRWEGPWKVGNHKFYKNNWHWYNFPTICRTEVLDNIVPKLDCSPLQGFELEMMKNFEKLNMKIGVMDQGAVTHLGAPSVNSSARLKYFKEANKGLSTRLPLVEYADVRRELDNFLEISHEN